MPNAVRAYPLEDASVVSPDQGPQPHVMRRGPVDDTDPASELALAVVLALMVVMGSVKNYAFEHYGVQGSIPTPHFHTGMLAR